MSQPVIEPEEMTSADFTNASPITMRVSSAARSAR